MIKLPHFDGVIETSKIHKIKGHWKRSIIMKEQKDVLAERTAEETLDPEAGDPCVS